MNKYFLGVLLVLISVSMSAQDYDFVVLDSIRDVSMEQEYPNNYFFYFDVWGDEIDGVKYAFLSSMKGVHVYKIVNNEFEFVDFEEARETSSVVAHRDYFVYENHLYTVCDEGNSSLQVFDLNYLPDSIHKVYDNNSEVGRAHNVWVDTSTSVLYAMGDWGMKFFDVTNPSNPIVTGGWYDDYVHDMYARNDTIYAFLPFTGLHIFKYNNGSVSTISTMYTYAEQGICHSGWVTEDGNYIYFADESRGKRMKAYDISGANIYSPRLIGLYGLTDYESVVHNIMQEGDYIFVAYYRDGFKVYSTKSTLSPQLVAEYTPDYEYPLTNKFDGTWGVYKFKGSPLVLFADQHKGLFLTSFENKTASVDDQDLAVDFSFKNGQLTLFWEANSEVSKVNLFDENGRLISSNEVIRNGYFSQNLSHLETGLYFYQIESNIGTSSGKFIKSE